MKVSGRGALAGAWILGCGAALAAESVIDRMRSCATELEDAKRLACYDLQIGRSNSGGNDDLGVNRELPHRNQKQAPSTPPPENPRGKVVAIANRGFGKFLVTLDNGQVWAQQDVPDFTLRVGDAVSIRRGALGALWMVSSSGRNQTRVHLLQ
jgi:hypothetical protein